MIKDKYTLYPKNMTYVRTDKDLVLFNVFYHKSIDTLFIAYKNSKTGEQIFDEFPEPLIPVYISKQKLKRMEQIYSIDSCTRHMVRYNPRFRSEDVKDLLYDCKEISYVDKYGITQYKKIYKDVPKDGYALNPNLFGYGDSIEQIILKEFALQRFEEHDGFVSEVIPVVKYDIASFDIETIQEDDTTKININTFIDQKSNTAYGIYVRDYEKYPFQDTIMSDLDGFVKETRDLLIDQINNMDLPGDPKNVEAVKNKCLKLAEDMEFKIIEVDSEEDLIRVSMHIIFEKHSPDVLVAFNTPYDETHFQKRIEELGLPVGLMNTKKYQDVRPKFMDGMNKEWNMFGDTRTSKKRSCSFDVIRPTHVMDYQMLYYSNRSFNTFSSESLQNTALRELGFGKLDFSKWSNSVVTLPFKNFRLHLSYGLIDSILLIMLNDKLHDIESKIAYTLITKNNIEQSVHSNPSISNWVFCTCVHKGKIQGVNKNKLIKRLSIDELKTMSELTDIDFLAYRSNIPSKWLAQDDEIEEVDETEIDLDSMEDVEFKDTDIRIRGGIVSPPQNYESNFKDFEKYNILNNEVTLQVFLKIKNDAYLDFKSHYPISFIARNLFMECINAEIVTLSTPDNVIIYSKNLRKDHKKHLENFSMIHMPIINDDIVTYSHRACGTPSMTEMIQKLMSLDSIPSFTIRRDYEFEQPIMNKTYDKFLSLMTTIDQSKFSDTETNFFIPSNKLFLGTNGALRYYGGRVDYTYNNGDLLTKMLENRSISSYENVLNDTVLLSRDKGILKNNPKLIPRNISHLPHKEIERMTKWYDIDVNIIKNISNIDFTSKYVKLPNLPIHLLITSNILYFPFKYYLNNFSLVQKHEVAPVVSDLSFRYLSRSATTLIQFKYNIKFKDIDLDIVQTMNVVNI